MRVETIFEQLFFTTVYLTAQGPDYEWVGTGFLYRAQLGESAAVVFLVTNRHVISDAHSLKLRFVAAGEDGPTLGRAVELIVEPLSSTAWIGHPDISVDVAVMPLNGLLTLLEGAGQQPFFRTVDVDLLATRESDSDLDAIENVTFVGYPDGLFDEANYLPIARLGTTATPPVVDYQGSPSFLIDAPVFQGSSGSPVFIADRGSYAQRGGGLVVGDRLILLGILALSELRYVSAEVTHPDGNHGNIGFADVAHLGIVFKSVCIRECIDEWLRSVGLPPE